MEEKVVECLQMKEVFLIGNRLSCYKILANNSNYSIRHIWAKTNSLLDTFLNEKEISHNRFDIQDKQHVMDVLTEVDYDILVSNGCPFILPATSLKQQGKILLNTHPTFLPHLRGATPLNRVFYKDYKFLGASTHYISDSIDSGNIVYQEKMDLTDDLDQGLVYYLSFEMEGVVFQKALKILEENGYDYEGTIVDVSNGCYFNRTIDKQTIDFENEQVSDCIRKIKSFNIPSQGCFAVIEGKKYVIYDGEKIQNAFILNKFELDYPGKILLEYGDSFLIKVADGIIKITKYKIEN